MALRHGRGAYDEEVLRGYFAAAGVDFAGLDRHRSGQYGPPDSAAGAGWRRALGPFTGERATLRGMLTYHHIDGDGRPAEAANPLVSVVNFGEQPEGIPMPPSYTYQVKLRTDGENYEVAVPVSQAIPAGGTDRFAFTIAADRASFHDLTLLLHYNDGAVVGSEAVSLEVFVSRFEPAG